MTTPPAARESGGPPHRLFVAPSRAGKTTRLIEQLLALRERDATCWARTLVWTRSPIAARNFADHLDAAATDTAALHNGYRPPTITTARAWAADAHRRGRFGLPPRRVWAPWVEREAIRAACVQHATAWPAGGDKRSADVPAYHKEILMWAGTLALNGLDPTAPPPAAVADSWNGRRARDLAAVLADVAEQKRRAEALGEHDLFPTLLAACEQDDMLAAWRAEVAVLIIDDAQDLPIGAARLAAVWAQGGGELWVAMDPDSPTSRFRGAVPEDTLKCFAEELDLHPERLPDERPDMLGLRAAAVLRGQVRADTTCADHITCVRVADEIEEAYELARQVRHAVYERRHDDTPLRYGDCAVVAQSLQPTGAYLADAFAFYDVPFVRRVGAALVNAPVVQFALAYLTALDDPCVENPPDALLTSAFAGPGLPPAAMHHLLRNWRTGDAREQRLEDAVAAETLAIPDGIDVGELRDSFKRWHTLQDAWHENKALSFVLRTLAQTQLLPALAAQVAEGDGAEQQHHAIQHLGQMLRLAETLERDQPASENTIEMLARAARTEVSTEEWDADGTAVDAVRILTPSAARDFTFRWLAVPGFTADRWPPRFRAHVLHLDRATAVWLGSPPLTLWRPDPETHEREWRSLAASMLERCDGPIVLSVPQDGADGNPLDPTAWLADLGAFVADTAPLAHPEHGLSLAHALTPPEAAAALTAVTAEDDALQAARTLLQLPAASPTGAELPRVQLGDRALSASLLNSYLECPRKCFYTRLLRIEDAPADLESAGVFGTLIHTVLERLHRSGRWAQWSTGDADDLRRAAHVHLAELWRAPEISAAFRNPIQRTYVYSRALAMLSGYARWICAEHAGTDVVLVEQGFTFTFAGAQIRGRIDRVDRLPGGRLRVIDYKTGSGDVVKGGRTLAQRFANVDGKTSWSPKDVQMAVYALAHELDATLPGPAAETAVCFLKVSDGADPAFPIVVWDEAAGGSGKAFMVLTEAQREHAHALLEQMVQEVMRGRFPARPAVFGSCRRCPAWQVCTGPEFAAEAEDA